MQFGSEVIPSEWRKLTLTAPKRDGTVSDVVLLRPLLWIEQQQAEVDGTVYISVPECGIDGNATVHRIEACPPIVDGPGRVITGTFRHQVAGGIESSVAGESQPIRCTGNHPIWSETHHNFVRADSLQPGETLRTTTGLTKLVESTPLPGQTHVYNLEVHGLHVYHVGESGLLVHNGGTGLDILGGNCVGGAQYVAEILAAGERLGIDVTRIRTTNGTTLARINEMQSFVGHDLSVLKQFARDRGATTLIIDSGMMSNRKFAEFLRKRAKDGRDFFGGYVRKSTLPGLSEFELIFSL